MDLHNVDLPTLMTAFGIAFQVGVTMTLVSRQGKDINTKANAETVDLQFDQIKTDLDEIRERCQGTCADWHGHQWDAIHNLALAVESLKGQCRNFHETQAQFKDRTI